MKDCDLHSLEMQIGTAVLRSDADNDLVLEAVMRSCEVPECKQSW